MESNYIASHPYQLRTAEPPRLIVPPPPMTYAHDRPSMVISGVSSYDYHEEFGNPEFLKLLVSYGCNLNHRMLEWKYEERRQAQPILPFLYLGPSSAAQDKTFLENNGITFAMAVRGGESLQARLVTSLKKAEDLGLETAVIVAGTPVEMIRNLPTAIGSINNHLQCRFEAQQSMNKLNGEQQPPIQGKALIFCENGNDRSPAVVLAYLMAMYNLSVVQSIQAVQSQRFCVGVDDSLKQMLLDFEGILRAKRDVTKDERAWLGPVADARRSVYSHQLSGNSHKRSIDAAYESSDDDMLDEDRGVQGITDSRRAGSAPFRDVVG